MVNVRKEICTMGIPRILKTTKFICDKCGAECNPDGADFEKLWELDDVEGHLCEACVKKIVNWEFVKEMLIFNDMLHEVRE